MQGGRTHRQHGFSPRTISLIAIHAHGIPTEFPKAVIDEAKAAKPVDPRGRTDLRAIPLVTIDPRDARDHDDAVWAGPDDDAGQPGGHVVLVAIADVAHYVTPGSALDKEALKRGNSAYFPDRVVPMLPEELSADLCSLKEGVDRPCLVVRMVFDAQGHKRSHTFLRGVMRSAARLTYAQAQAAFDGNPDADMNADRAQDAGRCVGGLQIAHHRARKSAIPLDLDLPERRVDAGRGRPGRLHRLSRAAGIHEADRGIHGAGQCRRRRGAGKGPTPLIYRVHDTPSKEKLFAFSDFLRTLNINFAKGQVVQPGTFNRILAARQRHAA